MTATLLISIVSNRIAEIIASYFKPLIRRRRRERRQRHQRCKRLLMLNSSWSQKGVNFCRRLKLKIGNGIIVDNILRRVAKQGLPKLEELTNNWSCLFFFFHLKWKNILLNSSLERQNFFESNTNPLAAESFFNKGSNLNLKPKLPSFFPFISRRRPNTAKKLLSHLQIHWSTNFLSFYQNEWFDRDKRDPLNAKQPRQG